MRGTNHYISTPDPRQDVHNLFTSHMPHPVFGLTAGLLLILCALACGIWANYNRPASRA